ncbi:hypothetical protein D9M68_693420 [compost metagenome]
MIQAQPRRHIGGKTVDHRISFPHQVLEGLSAQGVFQVQRHAAFSPVHRQEERRILRIGHWGHRTGIVAAHRLHLDDIGAQLRQQLAGERPAQHPRQIQYDLALQHACHPPVSKIHNSSRHGLHPAISGLHSLGVFQHGVRAEARHHFSRLL